MKLTGLSDLIAHLDPITKLAEERQHSRVFGLLQAAHPATLAALASTSAGAVLIVTSHPQSAADLAEELPVWTDRRVELFPAVETLPYERVRVDRTVLAQREMVVRDLAAGDAMIVVAPVRALLQPVQPPFALSGPLVLEQGQEIAIGKLIEWCVESGYAETALVEEPGTFARRGGVVDVYCGGEEQPVRVECFGNEIESLRAFDSASQRSSSVLPSVAIRPIAALDEHARLAALEALMDVDTSSMNAEAQTRWMDDLGRLEVGAPLDELMVFAPYLVEHGLLRVHRDDDAADEQQIDGFGASAGLRAHWP